MTLPTPIFAGSAHAHGLDAGQCADLGGRAWLIDWAWATPRDPGPTRRSGCNTPHRQRPRITEAEAIAARLPAYAAADPAHVAVFARANRKMWDEIETGHPVPWTQTMAAAARAWAQHRENLGASGL